MKTTSQRIVRGQFLATVLGTVAFAAAPGILEIDAEPVPDPWQPLRQLVGRWEGSSEGPAGTSRVTRTYAFVLNDHFLHATTRAVFPGDDAGTSGEVHEDLSLLSYDRDHGHFVMRSFHSEGYVSVYAGDVSPDGRELVFDTRQIENFKLGWRGRYAVRLVETDRLEEKLELSLPEGEFFACVTGRMRRVE